MTSTQTTDPGQRWYTVLDGGRLRRLRRQRGLSREQLAGLAGISPATVARLERQCAASCRSRTLGRLAAALGEDPDRLTSAGSWPPARTAAIMAGLHPRGPDNHPRPAPEALPW
jgi:DNA-binding XRE family transcriptional regulator